MGALRQITIQAAPATPHPAAAPPPRRWLRGAAWAAYAVVATLGLLELTLPLLDARFAPYFRRTLERSPNVREEIRAVLESPTFDPDLGWTKRPAADNYAPGKDYLAQAYGDSFTQSHLGAEEVAWEDYFERSTGHTILNFGVGGYGLDQAVLAFEKWGAEYPGRIALLGLYHQMYRRAHAHHSFYYFRNPEAWRYVFKPMLARKGGGYELLPPPCLDAACLEAVLFDESHPIRRTLAAHDHWYRQNAARPRPGFPRTIAFARAIPELLEHAAEDGGRRDYFFVTDESVDLAMALVGRFVHTAEERHMMPVMLLIYSATDLEIMRRGVRWDDALRARLDAAGIASIDTSPYISAAMAGKDLRSLRTEDGHMNESGDRLIAEALAEGLGRLGQLH